jgi:flagellar motor switch protein FliN
MKNFIDCWIGAASALFAQALAGEPELVESVPKPFEEGSFGFSALLSGDVQGRFVVTLDSAILETPLLGDGVDQKTGWGELLREVADSACGELLAGSGKTSRVEKFEPASAEGRVSGTFQLKSSSRAWTILVRDELHAAKPAAEAKKDSPEKPAQVSQPALSPGLELLLDVELEASLRFGCREMPLGELLDLGPGDVVQLDRHVADPVDLIIGDKIVARGEVVLVNGNFALRVTEVAAPRKRLESIRCLF